MEHEPMFNWNVKQGDFFKTNEFSNPMKVDSFDESRALWLKGRNDSEAHKVGGRPRK